jgi:hypothetical protein
MRKKHTNSIVEHFRLPSDRHLHVFLEDSEVDQVHSSIVTAAAELGFHLAVLDGRAISDRSALLLALAHSYKFPDFGKDDYARMGWDSVNDFLGDLMWLTGWPRDMNRSRGFLLLYLAPLPLFNNDAAEYAMLLDVASNAAMSLKKENIPFHIVLGPLNHRALLLIQMLKVGDRLCCTNLMRSDEQ